MSILVNGRWVTGPIAAREVKDGVFQRDISRFNNWIASPDAFAAGTQPFPAEAGRYQLFVALCCPWAGRTLIAHKLKNLQNVVQISVTAPTLGDEGWVYETPQDAGRRIGKITHHHQLYTATDPDYTGKVSVPVLWDRETGSIVNNESSQIMRMFNNAFDHLTGNTLDLYPETLRSQIDAWHTAIYPSLNNGVYQAGFAQSQQAHDNAVDAVFDMLRLLDEHLAAHRYLCGEYVTEADWRLFVTLVRFDVAYHGAFKCNLARVADYPDLRNYLHELYQWPGVRDWVDFKHIKAGYYVNSALNPSLVVPKGPPVDLSAPHDRHGLPGRGVWTRR